MSNRVILSRQDDADCYLFGDRNLPCIHPFRRAWKRGYEQALWDARGPELFPPARGSWWARFLPW